MKRTSILMCVCTALLFPVAAFAEAPINPPRTVQNLISDATPIPGVGRFAAGFSAYRADDLTIVTVDRPWQGATEDDRLVYLLYPRGTRAPACDGAAAEIAIPVTSIITMSTTFLPHLELLGVTDTIVGVDSLSWVYDEAIRTRGEQGEITEIGSGPAVDVERALVLNPDVIMVNSYGGEWDAQPVLENASLPVVVSGDWVETDPLGRAEWLLFTALFYDRLDEAILYITSVAEEYEDLRELAESASTRPTVLVNAPYQGTWAVSGGASYAAALIADAGGDYVWAQDGSTGSLFLDIESVFAEAGSAEYWINSGTWLSLSDGAAEDERFGSFNAFATGNVFNNNRRLSPAGGNDYHESGALRPHTVLRDLIAIFHTELVPGHSLFYYRQIQ